MNKFNFLLITLIFFTFNLYSANRYWIASSSSNWNNTANWSTTSGGSGGASVPGSSDIAYFDANGTGTCTLDVDATVDALIMSDGTLNTSTYNFTISGSDNSEFSGGTINGDNTFIVQPTGTAVVTFSGTTFNPDIDVVAPRILLNGSTFNGTSSFEKTGSTDDWSDGGNTFVGNSTIKNSSSNYFVLENSTSDDFQADVLLENTGSSIIYFANNSSGNTISGNLVANNTATGSSGDISFTSNPGASLTIGGTTTLNNNPTATDAAIYFAYDGSIICNGNLSLTNNGSQNTNRVYMGNAGDVTINGTLNIVNNSTATNSEVYCSNSGNNTYNGDIILECTDANSNGVIFGASNGTGTLADGKTITIGAGGYIGKRLSLQGFTQLGNTAQSIHLSSTTTVFEINNSEWNANVSFISGHIRTDNTTYNGTAYIEKIGSSNDWSTGGNTFNGEATIVNNGSGEFLIAYTSPNDFNANVNYKNLSTGTIYPSHNCASTYAGDINIDFNYQVIFGYSTDGRIIMDGSTAQSINDINSSPTPIFRDLQTNNPNNEITLNIPIEISTELDLDAGNIITSSTNTLTLQDNATVSSVSDAAYVDGPITKIGDDAFVFPVGGTDSFNNNHYAGIGISAPSGTTHSWTADYHAASHSSATTFSEPLKKVSLVEYWDLDRTVGSGNMDVTLYWDNGTRSGIGEITDLRVAHWNGSTWEDNGSNSTSGDASNGSITITGVSSFSPFTLGTIDNVSNTLPVSLLDFSVTKISDAVEIHWITASEENNAYFIIERSSDMINIDEIQRVGGADNSNMKLDYQIYDNNPINGISYYRLVQVDFDGNSKEYEWKSISYDKNNGFDFSVYPNPSDDGKIKLEFENYSQLVNVEILDASGRKIFSKNINVNNRLIPLNIELLSGLYLIRIQSGDTIKMKQLIVKN